LGDKVNN